MGKPRKRDKYVSKGIVGSPAKTRATQKERIMTQVRRWYAEKPTKVLVPSINNDSIMEKVDAVEAWGLPRPKFRAAKDED